MRVVKVLSALCVAILVMGSCDTNQLEAPVPISPIDNQIEDGSVHLSWESVEGRLLYEIEVADNKRFKDVIFYQVLKDTFCSVSADSFEYDQVYYWRVAAWDDNGLGDWSETESFSFEHIPVSLDTSYFPLAEGYEWIYEIHGYIRSKYDDEDHYDTLIVKVDSISVGEYELIFYLNYRYSDVGSQVEIVNDSLEINWYWSNPIKIVIPIIPEPVSIHEKYGNYSYANMDIFYQGDTLYISDDEYYEMDGYYGYSTQRLKGIGVVSEHDWFRMDGAYEEGHHLQLLYFVKGDTVWRFQ